MLLSTLLSSCSPCDYEKLSKLPDEASVPAQYRDNVAFIKDVRRFGIEQLGLHSCTQHYTTFSASDGEAKMLYRLFVAKPTVLPGSWASYSTSFEHNTIFREDVDAMYFNSFEDTLEDELEYYKSQGYDVFSRNVTSYNPPGSDTGSSITAGFLKDNKVWQAQTVLHEICHDSVEEWVGDFLPELNESFCGVVGRAGAVEYFKHKKGVNSEEYKRAQEYFHGYLDYSQKVNQFYSQLQVLYRSNKPISQKLEEREHIFAEIKATLDLDANNAVLCDNYSYVKYYPAMFKFYEMYNNDLSSLLDSLKNKKEATLQLMNNVVARYAPEEKK